MASTKKKNRTIEEKIKDEDHIMVKPSDKQVAIKEIRKSKEIIKSEFSVALQKAEVGINAMQMVKSKLVINEDNLAQVAEYLEMVRKAKSKLDETHKALKAPAWNECVMYDESRREMNATLDLLYNDVHKKYTEISNDIEKRKREAIAKKQREETIKAGIETNVISFTQRIADAKTSAEIVSVEKLVALEKTRKEKYAEFLPIAVERYDTLAGLIKDQKEKVKNLETLNANLQKAKDSGDEEAVLELETRVEDAKESVNEGVINIQEHAINEATKAVDVTEPEVVHPTVKTRRTTIKYEAVDINLLQKKMPHLVKLVLDEEKVKDLVKVKTAEGALTDLDEINIFGLRIYKEKLF